MEIPPDSSIAQSTSLFSGRTKQSILNSIASQYPVSENNPLIDSSNRQVAISGTNESKDFKFDDFREAYRMMNGPAMYPFQSIAQISNYKFDPFYFDGSENQPNFNVQENLIGTPLGTSLLEDPRLSYVKNLLTMKEYQGITDQLNDSYIKELYMVNSEKGVNYYINMLEKQDEALQNWSRIGRKVKSSEIDPISFTYNLPTGETQRPKPLNKVRVAQTSFSATPSVQRNYRQEVFDTTTRVGNEDIVNTRSPRGTISFPRGVITPAARTQIQSENVFSSPIVERSTSYNSTFSNSVQEIGNPMLSLVFEESKGQEKPPRKKQIAFAQKREIEKESRAGRTTRSSGPSNLINTEIQDPDAYARNQKKQKNRK